jgi:dethiobiotin synthetase
MVPLKGDYLTIDYIRERKLPVVLVTNGALGSISHTLLALDAISHAGIELYAVIYNSYFDKDKIIAEDTRNYIRRWLETHFKDTRFLEMGAIRL